MQHLVPGLPFPFGVMAPEHGESGRLWWPRADARGRSRRVR